MRRLAALAVAGLVIDCVFGCAFGCAHEAWKPPTSRDTADVPAALRPGNGNAELHVWSALAEPEAAALRGLDAARQGDVHALLALAILASRDHRDAASYDRYRQRIDQFIAEVKPTIDAAPDAWHRGYELHRAMHRAFFAGGGTELGGYDFYQARITGIFEGGRYNCLSSALLFAVLARGFGLPVRAALVPTHVFIEMGEPGGKVLEIETTSATGFDWVHDERFYRESAATWSGQRGLRPVTLDEYQHRTIIEPYQLAAEAMINAYQGDDEAARHWRDELAGVIDPDRTELQKERVWVYVKEAHDLYDLKAWRTITKMFDIVRPAVDDIGAKSKDGKTLELVSWANWYHANALMVVGRQDEAIAMMASGLQRLDNAWPDASTLRDNYVNVLVNRLGELIDRKDYPTAVTTLGKYGDVCRSSSVCTSNASIVFANWSIDHQNNGDWQSARQVLQDCVKQLPNDNRCRDALTDLESRHRF